jgi:5'-3' exoribonuclease 2
MLGLATHEPHFHVLREDVFFQESKARTCRLCGQAGHKAEECTGTAKPKDGEFDEKGSAPPLKPFIWLHVSVLREYLAVEMNVSEQPFPFDLERALDDWVFMCFFVGNDFLPHLPSLDIKENGIDTLIAIWRDNLPLMRGYLTRDGHVDLERCQFILNGLAKQEDAIFKRRRQAEERRDANAKRRKMEEDNRKDRRAPGRKSPDYTISSQEAFNQNPLPLFAPSKGDVPDDVKKMTHEMAVNRGAVYKADTANKSAAAALKSQLIGKASKDSPTVELDSVAASSEMESHETGNVPAALGKRKASMMEDGPSTPGRHTPNPASNVQSKKDEEPTPDTVRLWEDGYADRYYEQKFSVDPKDIAFRNKVAASYVEGLAWVLLYYFQGCPSWRWYYPYHYAPFAADFVGLDSMDIKFQSAAPLKPYEQLMGVLPAASNQAIPAPFRPLMEEADSEIIDFYPEDFHVDLNGKKWAWQGVAILPFIDEKRLLDAMATKYPLLSKDELERNETGKPVLIFSDRHQMFTDVASNFFSKRQNVLQLPLDPKKSHGLCGIVEKDTSYVLQSPLVFPISDAMPTLDDDHSVRSVWWFLLYRGMLILLSVHYEMPASKTDHKSMLLNGVKLPTPALNRADIEATRGRASRTGRSFGGAPFRGGGRGGGRGGRGGSINYADSRANPFAQHLQAGFVPPPYGNGNGYQQQNHGYGQGQSRGNGYSGGSDRGPPNHGHAYGSYQQPLGYNNGGNGIGGGYGSNGGYDRGRQSKAPPRHYHDNSAPPPPPGNQRYR